MAMTETPTLIPVIFLGNCPVSALADREQGRPGQTLRYTTRGDGGRRVRQIKKDSQGNYLGEIQSECLSGVSH